MDYFRAGYVPVVGVSTALGTLQVGFFLTDQSEDQRLLKIERQGEVWVVQVDPRRWELESWLQWVEQDPKHFEETFPDEELLSSEEASLLLEHVLSVLIDQVIYPFRDWVDTTRLEEVEMPLYAELFSQHFYILNPD